ncbi:MAG: DMT family transporter [Clostridiales bacterium]|nr:DMT family transporter [Clostridiales bacterium]
MENLYGKKQHICGILMLTVTTLIWGAGFVLNAELRASSFVNASALLNAVRFGVSTLILLAVFNRRIRFDKYTLLYGAVGGALLFGGFLMQTIAFSYTTPAHNGFFTTAYVVFVPFIAWIIYKKRPSWAMFLGTGIAICGLLVLNLKHETLPDGSWKGDLLALGCALCFAFQIMWTDVLLAKNKTDSIQLAFWQVAFAAILFIAYTLIFEHKYVFGMDFDFGYCWWRLAIVVIGGTAFAYYAQSYAQKHVSPTETSILMACESPIGAVLSLIVGLDVFSWTIPVGGGMLVAAVILVEIVPNLTNKRKKKENE